MTGVPGRSEVTSWLIHKPDWTVTSWKLEIFYTPTYLVNPRDRVRLLGIRIDRGLENLHSLAGCMRRTLMPYVAIDRAMTSAEGL